MMVNVIYRHSQSKPHQLGSLQKGLYYLDTCYQLCSSVTSIHTACTTTVMDKPDSITVNKAKLWHLRLGHLPFTHLNKVKTDIDVKSCIDQCFCQICYVAKQTRLPFHSSTTQTSSPFEIVHIDRSLRSL